MLICEKCGEEHDGDYGTGRFCCEKCAKSHPQTEERKEHLRRLNTGKNYINGVLVEIDKKLCIVCGKEAENRVSKYCSGCRQKATSKNLSKSLKGKTGGVRKGSGRSKFGYYKGIFCGSTYELVWVIYNIDHNIDFKRFEHHIPYNETKYFPDFIIDNTIIEIKGRDLNNTMPAKIKASTENGYEIKVLYKDDLKEHFKWVKDNYQYKNVQELYDDYKPKYEYTCFTCGEVFSVDRKRRTLKVYCNRLCSGRAVGKDDNKEKAPKDEIIRLHNEGLRNCYISKQLGIPYSTVGYILNKNREAADVATILSRWGDGIETHTVHQNNKA